MARAALDWPRDKLAIKTGVCVRTIAAFEGREGSKITKANNLALKRTLEDAGLIFTETGVDLKIKSD